MSIYNSKSCTGKDGPIESLLLTSAQAAPVTADSCGCWREVEADLPPTPPQEQRIAPEKLALTLFFFPSAFPAKTSCCFVATRRQRWSRMAHTTELQRAVKLKQTPAVHFGGDENCSQAWSLWGGMCLARLKPSWPLTYSNFITVKFKSASAVAKRIFYFNFMKKKHSSN